MNETIIDCLNQSDNYKDFMRHWHNYELTYVERFTPTEKQYEKLKASYKNEPLAASYFKPWLTKVKEIVEQKQCQKISGKLVDMQTANLMLDIYNKLSDANKLKFSSMEFPVAHHIAWELYSKSKEQKQ